MILRTLGSIPGPIIFGRVLDLACVVWSTECGKQGSCELYKNEDLAAHMVALAAIIKVSMVNSFLLLWKVKAHTAFVKRPTRRKKLLNKSCVFTLAFSVGIKIIAPGEDLSVPNICAWLLACFHFICVVARYIWSRISVLRTAMRNKALHRNRVVIAILKYKATEAKDVIETFVILSTSK